MKAKPNYYQILHVQPDAPLEIIRSSYRTLMQKMRMHPDLGGDSHSAAEINEAYAILTDPAERAAYDKSRLESATATEDQTAVNEREFRASMAPFQCTFCKTGHEYQREILPDTLCTNCSSPLCLAAQTQLEEDGRRTISRVPSNHAVEFYTQWPQAMAHTGRTDDISLNGLKFFSDTQLVEGQIIKLDSQILRAVAVVIRAKEQRGSWVVAVQFISLYFEKARGSFIAERA